MRYNLYNLYPLETEPSVYSQCRSSCMSEIKVAFWREVGCGGEVERERERDRQTDRQTDRQNSKNLFYKNSSLGSVKNL